MGGIHPLRNIYKDYDEESTLLKYLLLSPSKPWSDHQKCFHDGLHEEVGQAQYSVHE